MQFRFSPAKTVAITIVLMTGACLLWQILPAVLEVQRAERRKHVSNKFRQVLISLNEYASVNGTLPMSIQQDSDGTALSSWRFQLTPYLVPTKVELDLGASWEAPINAPYAKRALPMFCNPPSPDTIVFAIVGEETAINSGAPTTFEDLPDDIILVIEVHNSGVHWMAPGDLSLAHGDARSYTRWNTVLGSGADEPFHVGFADGTVWCLQANTPVGDLIKFATVTGAWRWQREDVLQQHRVH